MQVRERIRELPAAASGVDRTRPVNQVQAEVTRLRQEVAKLRMEKEISNQAVATFAKESMGSTPGSKRISTPTPSGE